MRTRTGHMDFDRGLDAKIVQDATLAGRDGRSSDLARIDLYYVLHKLNYITFLSYVYVSPFRMLVYNEAIIKALFLYRRRG
jgi:hypothetical protein